MEPSEDLPESTRQLITSRACAAKGPTLSSSWHPRTLPRGWAHPHGSGHRGKPSSLPSPVLLLGFIVYFFPNAHPLSLLGDVKPRVPLSVTSRQHGSRLLHLGSRKAGFIFLSGSFKTAQFPWLKKRETKEN